MGSPDDRRRVSAQLIERYVTGELDAGGRAEMSRLAAADSALAARIAEREAEHRAFLVDARRRPYADLLREAGQPMRRPSQRLLWGISALAAASALVVVAVMVVPEAIEKPPDQVRLKGKPGVQAAVLHQGQTRLLTSGENLEAGDRLRLVVDDPRGGFVTVLLQDCGGEVAVVYRPEEIGRVTAGRIELPGSIELDAAAGTERLFVIVSDELPDPAAWQRELEIAFERQGIHHDWLPAGQDRAHLLEWSKARP
ncbi:MAG: hypothetical protein JXR83_22360 [Deltaproteobacteria bacterium]|nr:hypothetical protein [Deltaproteobacteria bacterium]